MARASNRRFRSGSALLAASLTCSLPSLAAPATAAYSGPTQVLPEIFSRIDYVVNVPAIPRAEITFNAANVQTKAPTSVQDTQPQPAPEPANPDLDLALENFFFALEDLIQSAARNSPPKPSENAYLAEVQFPVQVMTSMNAATTAASTAVVAQATLPPTTVDIGSTGALGFLDGFKYSSQLGVNIEYNDNIYTSRTNRASDVIARTDATGTMESRTRKSALKLEGAIHSGNNQSSAAENYVDYSATGSYSTLLSERSKAFVGLGYFNHHEDRGEGSTDGDDGIILGEPVEFESWVARGIYERGTKKTRSRFVADAKIDQLRTNNFRDLDVIAGRDRDINAIVGTAFYNWSQRMSFLVELRHQDIAYVQSSGSDALDSTQTRYALGAEWLATRKTAGSVRVGVQEKDFDELTGSDIENISWEAIVEWTPRPRSELVFETTSDTSESDGFGTSRDSTDYKITWKQKWNPRLASATSVQYGTTDFQNQIRSDELSLINAELSYSMNASTSASIKLTYVDNSSNVTEYSFDRSQIQLGLDMEL